jgi:RNA polymerase sigma-70 factor (ECF subfamily)
MSASSVDDSLTLLKRAQAGDAAALDTLLSRYRPRLSRWAHGRLPRWARDAADTDDLIQNTLVGALRNLNTFQIGAQGGFHLYLRTAIANSVRDHIRVARRREFATLNSSMPADEPSALEHVMGAERLARYEVALAALSEDEREAIVARFEFGLTHAELASALGKPTPDAARKHLVRAIRRLLAAMDTPHQTDGR